MNPIKYKMLFSLISLAIFSGCATKAPYLDSKFGHAVNAAKGQQTLNPEASRNTDPVSGLDGKAGKESMDRYDESFKTPPKTFNVININTGQPQ
jgi:hypothetical protein